MSDIEKVKKLREATGAGFKDCNLAIKESGGDLDKAVEILRVKGISKASKKMSRDAKEGVVAVSGDEKKTSIIEVNCETDFVAKNDDFVKLAYDIADIALNCKTKEELLSSPFGNSTVSEKLIEQTGVIGEKIQINDFSRIEANYVGTYIHAGNKISSLVGFDVKVENIETVGKDISMQIAAMNPIALDKESVDPELIKKEIEIAKDQLKTEGKPEELIEKIAIGKLNRFFKDNTLINQQFIKENKVSVAQYLKTFGDIKILSFSRVSIG